MDKHDKLIKTLIKYGLRKRLKRAEREILENWVSKSEENRKVAEDLRDPARQADVSKEFERAPSSREMWKEICNKMGWEVKSTKERWGHLKALWWLLKNAVNSWTKQQD